MGINNCQNTEPKPVNLSDLTLYGLSPNSESVGANPAIQYFIKGKRLEISPVLNSSSDENQLRNETDNQGEQRSPEENK